jgi:hypothetical protein
MEEISMENKTINLVTDETVNEILSSLDDFDAENAWYEVWAIGYDCDGDITGTEILLGTFDDPDAAVQYASIITWADIKAEADGAEEFVKTSDMLSIEVETVVNCEDEEEGTMNVGTIFAKSMCVFIEDIRVTSKDFEIVEDDKLKISCKLLKDFNKNDKVKVYFTEEKMILTYKIISRVIYDDGEYYHLDLLY